MCVPVKHGLLFLFLSVFVRSRLEGCKAEFIINMRMSGTGIFWGRSSSLGRNRCALVVPVPGWCWVRASLTMAFWKYLWERQSATLNIFHLLLVLSCLFSWERVMGTVYLVRIRIWKRSQLKTGFAVRRPKLSQAIVSPNFKAALGLNLALTTCPWPWTPGFELVHRRNLSIRTHHPACWNALWFNVSLLYFSHILKCSFLGKKDNSCLWTGPE